MDLIAAMRRATVGMFASRSIRRHSAERMNVPGFARANARWSGVWLLI
jgi:hypothetical protein